MDRDVNKEIEEVKEQISETEVYLDKIRGCFLGGAVGDTLGYPVEFLHEDQIISKFGNKGITEYELDSRTGKALICRMSEYGTYRDHDWERKYIYMHWHEENAKPAGGSTYVYTE